MHSFVYVIGREGRRVLEVSLAPNEFDGTYHEFLLKSTRDRGCRFSIGPRNPVSKSLVLARAAAIVFARARMAASPGDFKGYRRNTPSRSN
jgi:hypothetical protein